MNWEPVDHWNVRTKVLGGWLLKSYDNVTKFDKNDPDGKPEWKVSLVFIPDVYHQWEIKEPCDGK